MQCERIIGDAQWKFTIRRTARTGGGPIGYSSIYRLFTNPFYAGFIRHKGELYKGNHEPMITLEEFDYVQGILGRKGKPRQSVFDYAYTGLLKCGTCGCRVVGKANTKFVKRDGAVKTYVHYHCTRRSLKRPCEQTKYTSLENFEDEIEAELKKYTILPEFRDLALDILRRNNELETYDRTAIYKSQQKRRGEIQTDLDKLVKMKLRDQLDDAEYSQQRTELKKELARIDEALRGTEGRAEDWMELTERAFNFAAYAPVHFRQGDLKTKRDILMTLGENLLLKDGKLLLEANKWLIPLEKDYPAVEVEYLNARTNKKASLKSKEEALMQVNDSWRAIWDSNPGHAA